MVPSQDARTAAASIALHAAIAATHAGCIAVYIADWRRFLWNEDYPPVPNKYFETYIHTKAADDVLSAAVSPFQATGVWSVNALPPRCPPGAPPPRALIY